MERTKYIYSKGNKGVIIKYSGRHKMWHAELHLDKKMKLYEFKTLEEAKLKMKQEGYELIGMSYKAKDFSEINKKYY